MFLNNTDLRDRYITMYIYIYIWNLYFQWNLVLFFTFLWLYHLLVMPFTTEIVLNIRSGPFSTRKYLPKHENVACCKNDLISRHIYLLLLFLSLLLLLLLLLLMSLLLFVLNKPPYLVQIGKSCNFKHSSIKLSLFWHSFY